MNVPYFNKDRIAEVLDLDKLIAAVAIAATPAPSEIQPASPT